MTSPPSSDRLDPGALRFVRYAFPPNELGYCGPADHVALFEYAATATVDGGLRSLAAGFDGAWPYLEVIAAAHGIADPLDERVVTAYWLGGPLLDGIPVDLPGRSLDEHFRARGAVAWSGIADTIDGSTRLSHGFHVFSVYPWVGLLRSGPAEVPLHVLDRCRIRWGEVIEVDGLDVVVRSPRLRWDDPGVSLSAPVTERARRGRDGVAWVDVVPGDVVSLHWDWVCERLAPAELAHLRRDTTHQLSVTNRDRPHSGIAQVIG
jgi:hypothetical protein